jgi:hydrogenase expression/formation protein HypE
MIPPGKLPSDLLDSLLRVVRRDEALVVAPGVGLDAAVIDLGGDELLVASSDPITFAASRPAQYAVAVNANDIAVMGGRPRWFLATVLLPEGIAEETVRTLFAELKAECATLGVTLAGGHTEVTATVSQPVIAGTMLGTVARDKLVKPSGARPGDELWLAGALAVEGTAILCREAAKALKDAGVPADVIESGAALLDSPGISVVGTARRAVDSGAVTAMHDPTEGGLASALHELAHASVCGLTVEVDSIPILDETRIVCAALGLEPLGLLASGSLLMAVNPDEGDNLSAAFDGAGISATKIGTVVEVSEVWTEVGGERRRLLPPSRDELARFLEQVARTQ